MISGLDNGVHLTYGGSNDDQGKGIRYLEWRWRPTEQQTKAKNIYYSDMIYAIKDKDGKLEIAHDGFENGLFNRDFWIKLLFSEGFTPMAIKDDPKISNRQFFLGKKLI